MRRRAPRPLRIALERTAARAAPPSLLASVQSAWAEVAGVVVAEETEPVSERDGVVTVACRSAVWAQELELLRPDLENRLSAHVAGPGKAVKLRFRTASGAGP